MFVGIMCLIPYKGNTKEGEDLFLYHMGKFMLFIVPKFLLWNMKKLNENNIVM